MLKSLQQRERQKTTVSFIAATLTRIKIGKIMLKSFVVRVAVIKKKFVL